MDVTREWGDRLKRDFGVFATGTAAAIVAAGVFLYLFVTSKGSGFPVLVILITVLSGLPAMLSARLTIAFRRFLRKDWQLLPLSALCGFVTIAGLASLYALSSVVATWNPTEYGPAFVWPSFERAAVVGLMHYAIDAGLIPAGLGALVAAACAALWLRRERGAGNTVSAGDSAPSARPSPAAGQGIDQGLGAGRAAIEERFFWSTTIIGPVIIGGMFVLVTLIFPSSKASDGGWNALWFMLQLYYGGSFAAAVAAGLMLALVYNRSRRTAWAAALCVGIHAGAIFLLLFAPAEGNTAMQSELPYIGGIVGALSAAACTAIWFPDRRGQTLGDRPAASAWTFWRWARILLIAGFVAPLAAASAYGLFAAAAQLTGAASESTFIGRMRRFDPEIWAIALRIWAVVALQALALHHFLRVKKMPLAAVAAALVALLFAGAMGHSLDDYALSTPMPVSAASFIELGLPGLVAAIAALCLVHRRPSRQMIDAGRAAA